MIEGDTVYQAARRLDAALAGRVLASSTFRDPSHRALDLSGCRVGSVVSRGKHVLIRVGALILLTNLDLGGRWEVYASGERARTPASHAVCVLRHADFQAVGFGLPSLRIFPARDEQAAFAHLGPDLLGHSWDPAEAVRRLLSDPDRPIGLALLDQRLVAGIGDVYRSEVLFLARTHPHTRTGEVADLPRLVHLAHELLHANRDRARRLTAPPPQGEPYWVYGRAGLPCPRCGTTVARDALGALPSTLHDTGPVTVAMAPEALAGPSGKPADRDVFWCPQCQPGPARMDPGPVGIAGAGVCALDPDPGRR